MENKFCQFTQGTTSQRPNSGFGVQCTVTGNHHQWKTKVIHALQQMYKDKGSEHAASSAELQQSGSPMIIDELCNKCT